MLWKLPPKINGVLGVGSLFLICSSFCECLIGPLQKALPEIVLLRSVSFHRSIERRSLGDTPPGRIGYKPSKLQRSFRRWGVRVTLSKKMRHSGKCAKSDSLKSTWWIFHCDAGGYHTIYYWGSQNIFWLAEKWTLPSYQKNRPSFQIFKNSVQLRLRLGQPFNLPILHLWPLFRTQGEWEQLRATQCQTTRGALELRETGQNQRFGVVVLEFLMFLQFPIWKVFAKMIRVLLGGLGGIWHHRLLIREFVFVI